MRINFLVLFLVLAISWRTPNLFAAEVKAIGQTEWDKTVEAAKKEGKLVAGIPASAELRKSITESFKSRFPGIELELTTSRGPTNASKISAEHAAGVRYFDLLISGTSTPFNLLNAGILDPVEPLLILPEVKDPKRWFGGHIWLDNSKRFLYAFQAYQSQNFWYNSTLTKPEEIRSYDDLLNPKWKNRIGYLDPRSAGGGTATWAFFLKIKGEEFLKKLAAQDMLLSRDQRQLGDSLSQRKGRADDRPDLLQLGAFHQSRTADPIAPGSQRGNLHELRQRRIVDRQGFTASKRHQSIRELVAEQRGARGLRQSDGPGDPPSRCRNQMAH